ncbi:MAG: aspartate--tRNA ligase [Candidatus Pacebacteria bacterium]|jgi:aspartyl-tRNA synthetase|nr:aspartate--tRNA ligase [Candidatus Paceibacterota bacterium]|tara:strand:+ start:675 stop:2069 length:1395 start_codon:yes stop_codon:yes gene_type:complete
MSRIYIKDLHNHIGKEVNISGWIDVRRDQGKMIFFDFRDMSGKVQGVILPDASEAHEVGEKVRSEWVVEVYGKVNKRPEKMINKTQENGDIEIGISELKIINEAETPVFDTHSDGYEVGEENRLKYRYLDLRRPRLQKNIKNRSKVVKFIRDYLTDEGFVEIDTPILTKSSPEGARDYIVPSRVEKGKFYALPQSPQQYKQLLMVAGLEKYFQIAKAMRDEDTRGDRQPEFTQLDLEMSFTSQEEILDLTEVLFTKLVKEIYPEKKITKKPWPRLDYDEVMEKYGTDSPDLRKDKNNPGELAFAWILNFPLFEKEKEGKYYAPSHHMFTAPKEEDVSKLESDPGAVRSYQYDMVLNGYEVGGGSIRIHDSKVQERIFDLIGFDKKEKEKFSHMLTAFKYGVPPHGGIAPGIDRLMMVFENEPNIREVIAFPKTGEGRDLMMDAPSEIDETQLKELGIKITKDKK